MTVIDFFVAGDPIPQGSSVAVRSRSTGRAFVKASNEKNLKAWRQRVASEAQRASEVLDDGPVMVIAHFRLTRSKSRPKRETWPAITPDVDKLLRAVLDGITKVLIADDKQVCIAVPLKSYAAPGEQPGVRVIVRPLWAEEAGDPYRTAGHLLGYASGLSQTASEALGGEASDDD